MSLFSGVDVVFYQVCSMDKAVAFYSGLLGMPEVPKPGHLVSRGGCWFRAGQFQIHLGVEQDFRPARKAHPALLVKDLGALQARLEAAGADVATDEPFPGFDRIYVYDPFGNRIELLQPDGVETPPST